MDQKIKSILSDILDIDEDSIGPTFGPNDADNWDSLNNLRIITELESEFGIRLSMSEIQEMTTFSAIVEKIQKHL